MAFPARKAGAGGRRLTVAVLALLGWAVAAPATVTFIVNTNRDLDDFTPNQPMSLRKAIRLANETDLSLGDVLITFDPTVFASLSGAGWNHVNYNPPNNGLYYDEPDLIAPANDPNRIIVGTPELGTEPGFNTDSVGQPLPLPCITRDNVKIKGELNNDGIPDVRIDLGELLPTNVLVLGFFIIPVRSFGFQIGVDAFSSPMNSASGQISNVVLEGLDIRFAPGFSPADQSPPAVWISNGTNHRIVNSDLQGRGIGVQTDLQLGNQVFIGGISPGSNNSISGYSYAGIYCTGAGTTTIQQNNITGCGTGTDAGNDISGGVVLVGTGSNVVGGTVSGSRNTIASNTTEGVVVAGSGQNFVQNNAITGNSRSGIWIFGSGNNIIGGSATLSGNTISGNGTQAGGFYHAGVFLTGGGNNTVQGNVIGSGNGNGGAGIYITGDGNNRIGGTATAARNIVGRNGALASSESSTGIDIRGDGVNIIENNYVGTDASGQASDQNVGHGISIGAEAGGDNLIGGTQVASRNVISGNGLNGLRLGGTGDNVITGNYIGLAADGQSALGNNINGIEIAASAGGNPVGINGNRIGGDSAAERNVISSNGSDGITVNGTGDNLFYGNYLGLAADGATQRANGRHGISITVQALGNNVIGNRAPGRRNVIAGNGQFGVSIESTPALNKVQSNYIGINAAATDGVFNGAGGVSVSSPVGQLIGGSELGDGNIVSGNRENANADGIELLGAGDHVVAGNVIGAAPVNPAGFPQDARLTISDVFRNGGTGILIGGGSTGSISVGFDPTDGSPDSNLYEGNVIVNNNGEGIQVAGSGNVTIVNNLIGVGLNAAGTYAAMGNARDGILLSGAGANVIGRDEESLDPATHVITPGNDLPNTNWFNVISGNSGNGISVTGPGNNVITANRVGTTPTGTTAVANTGDGVNITGTGDNTVQRDTISGNGGNGIFQFAPGTTTVIGNTIGAAGLDRSGTGPLPNGGHGVFVPNNAPGRLVLGLAKTVDPIGFNVISGNAADGVHIEGNVSNTLEANLIGTNGENTLTGVRGNAAVANGGSGVYLQGPKSASNEVVDNTISGNALFGVHIVSGGNLLRRNKIGTNDIGDAALGNGSHGIFINDPNLPTERAGQLIGRLAAGNVRESNIISGNAGDGIHIAQAGGNVRNDVSDDVVIFTNFIGLDATGLNPIGNTGDGIEVESGCTGRVVIGGTTNGQGNVIAGNTGWGLRFESEYSYNRPVNIDNTPLIYGNYIGTDQQGAQTNALLRNGGGILVNVDAGGIPNDPRVVPIGAPTGRPQIGGVFLSTNLISGNAGDAVRVDGNAGVPSAGADIVGCFIGTDSFGRAVIGNTGNGIAVTANHTGTVVVGGVGQINRNLIAGSGQFGLNLDGTGAVAVVNNYIGARESAGGPLTFDGATGGNAAGGVLLAGGTGTDTATLVDNVIFRGGTNGGIRTTYTRTATLDANTVSW
ncbi:MAG: right-handed parallel beta-helix repeat-containing protein, partial [Armatimonadetes bacterium]|nr:right-handed parallel beta-helix repeat-containing protein [Armatimonadota bacterium]